MSGATFAIAVDLGGTQIRTALVSREGRIHTRRGEPTMASAGPDAVTSQIAALVRNVSSSVAAEHICGAGVSSPGPLDTQKGVALGIPTLAGFEQVPLREMLHDKLSMPVALENDGISAAIGEWKFGAGKGRTSLLYVTVSTGIGGGAIIDGRVLRGSRGMAGHVGHMTFTQGGEVCACGARGCFEAYASGTAFTRRAALAATADASSTLHRLHKSQFGPLTAQAVFSAAAAGDALARQLVNEQADFLGRGFASLLHLYSPELLIMGGGIAQQFDALAPRMMQSLKASAMPAFRETIVVPAALGTNSGLVGAASLVFDGLCDG